VPSVASEPGAAVLIVDDDPGKRLAITAVLEPLGLVIVEAESGEEALHRVLEQAFAVILMDVRMPGMDGYETAKLIRMRRESEHTPIIFVTAYPRDEARVPDAYESGAVDFIFAPILPDILRAKISVFVELFLKSRELEQSLTEVTVLSERFRDGETRTRSVLDNVADGIVTVSDDGLIESFNRAATGLFDYGEQEAIGQPFANMIAPRPAGDSKNDDTDEMPLLSRQRRSGRSVESMGRRRDGSTFPMELDLSDVQLGTRTIHIACLRDISARRAYTSELRYQALHDVLTDLPNRVLFSDRVQHALGAAVREDHQVAILLLDLDDFKQVNDTLGHPQGDLLLKLVADRLVGCLRAGDTVARLGGDEFGVLPMGSTDLAEAVAIAWKIQRALEPAFVVEGRSIDATTSIGITLAPDHGDNVDDLLRRADLAMYDAKRTGTGYALFAAEQEEAPARRVALLGNLRHCIEREELVLHYQPKIDLATQKTVGVEALVRWNHPSGRLFMPSEFMPEVERNELMIPITEWVIGEALETLRKWLDAGLDLSMAVNLGARCLAQGANFFDGVDKLTAKWRIPPGRLTFELTESALIDTEVPGLLDLLKTMDEPLSIDDFGTGYSSLVYLQQLPVVEIKADRSFVMTMNSVKDDAVIVRSIVDLAHNLGVKVIAEGVEDEATMNQLNEYGCDAAQGYHFSRPVPGEELEQWFETSSFGPASLPGPAPAVGLAAA
jgi:diguanylate cyclase (GGDEF)-like protein/PAS domain S-box-containing protein